MKKLFGGAYAGRRVLVTGHTGFKGSWLSLWLTELGAEITGLALPPDTAPSHWNLLGLDKVRDLRVDLRNRAAVLQALEQARPEIVFHLAAQPLVRRSYREPTLTFESNVLGLVHLFEAVRATGSVRAFVNVTSDKVYREMHTATGYREEDPLGGHDPYSTSKACAELVTECYRKSFFGDAGISLASARAGNVLGGGDWAEDRLVPDFVRAAASGKTLELRNLQAVRPWQHVLEPLSGYLRLGQALLGGQTAESAWNFGPGPEAAVPVKDVVSQMLALWPASYAEVDAAKLLREAPVLTLDSAKAAHELHWFPVWTLGEALGSTIRWYREFYSSGRIRSREDLSAYAEAALAAGLEWAT